MLTVSFCLIVGAFLTTIASALGKCPGWIPTLLLCVWALLTALPR